VTSSRKLQVFFALSLAAFLSILVPRRADAADAAPTVRLRRFALLVGVNDGGQGRQRLRYAVSDARSLERVLESMGGVAPEDAVFLSDPDRAGLVAAFDRTSALVRRSATPGVRRELLVYYSGHSDEEGLLIQGSRMSYDELRARLQAIPADVRVAILDSCSSGAFTRRKGGVHRAPFLMDASVDMRGHAILTSSSANEVAQESDRIGGSFFTHFLVSGLRGAADVNGDRRVTLQEAFQFASQETLARTERTQGGPQHAAYEFDLAGTGELVVTDVRSTRASLALSPDLAGRISVRDAGGDLVAELRKGAGHPVELGLEPGPYVVTMDGATALFEAQVTLTSGQRAELSRLAFHPVGAREVAMARGGAAPDAQVSAAAAATATATPAPAGAAPLTRVSQHASLVGIDPTPVDVHGISMGLVADRVARLTGFQFAFGLVRTDEELHGVQLSTGVAMSRGTTRGLQLGTVANVADGTFRGVQLADMISMTRGDAQGLQLTGGVNYAAGTFTGLQVASLNLSDGALTGLQLAGIDVARQVTGAQVSAINVAGQITGFQLGGINYAGETSGFQLAAINVNKRAHGFQFGAINVITEDEDGEAFGVITYARNGIHEAAVYTSDTMASNVVLRLGTRHLYTSFGAAFHPGDELTGTGPVRFSRGTRRMGTTFGVGWRFPVENLGRLEALELEASGTDLYPSFDRGGENPPLVSALRLQGAIRLVDKLAIMAGVGMNVSVAWGGRDADVGLGVLEKTITSGDTTVRIYPGFVLGIQI
jgi:hypothetical protein